MFDFRVVNFWPEALCDEGFCDDTVYSQSSWLLPEY
jgi:hypothetical protein